MWKLFKPFFAPPAPPAPRLVTLANRCDEIEERIEGCIALVRKLSGRIGQLSKGQAEPETHQDAPETSNGDEPQQMSVFEKQIAHGRILNAMRGGRGILPR